jgi:hypothetical protein
MNIKLNIGKNKRDSEKRENKGMSRRENVTGDIQTQKIYLVVHILQIHARGTKSITFLQRTFFDFFGSEAVKCEQLPLAQRSHILYQYLI